MISAVTIYLACVLAIAMFGGLIGYLDGRNRQVAKDQERLRITREAIEKGSGGDIARAEAKVLETRINAASDDGRATLRAQGQAGSWAGRAALVGLVPLGAWLFTRRLKTAPAG
jgi:hypothetical protein